MLTSVGNKRKRGGDRTTKRIVSYGILLYKRRTVEEEEEQEEAAAASGPHIQFLLGLIPQRTNWTVFKGVPDDAKGDETPYETALREFNEETGAPPGLLTLETFRPEATLHGRAGRKHLEIYLHEGSFFRRKDHFCPERVVKIDNNDDGGGGYMQGMPEIVDVQWMTLKEALVDGKSSIKGGGGATIYKSQENILKEAHEILCRSLARTTTTKTTSSSQHE